MKIFLKAIVLITLITLMFHQTNKISAASPSIDQKTTNDLVLTLLSPTINKTVQNYYKQILTIPVVLPPYAMEITNINRPEKTNQYKFDITIKLLPYVGPHLTVGIDIIKLTVNLNDTITVNEYKHIKSFNLPPHYKLR